MCRKVAPSKKDGPVLAIKFARKTMRYENEGEVDGEATVMEMLSQKGQNENIIEFLHHGSLEHPWNFKVCFIDMELADLTLSDYIKYVFHGGPLPFEIDAQRTNPTFSPRGSPELLERLHTVWTIGAQIAGALAFLHENNQAHRDLTPSNGMYAL
jgi:serine/threonine protein kinase